MIFTLPNPVPAVPIDPEDLQTFYQRYAIIPYYGNSERSSSRFLDLLTTLAQVSPTYQACSDQLKRYTIGDAIKIVIAQIPGLVSEKQEIELPGQIAYTAFLQQHGVKVTSLIEVSKRVDDHIRASGNAYIRIMRMKVEGRLVYAIDVPHYEHCAYMISQDAGYDFLIISKFMGDEQKMMKYQPMFAAATIPGNALRWTATKDPGIDVAVIHVRTSSNLDQCGVYGRPATIPVMAWMYVDHEVAVLNSKISASAIISKKVIAFQAPNPDTLPDERPDDDLPQEIGMNGKTGGKKMTAFQEGMLVLKNLTTNLGQHPSVNPQGAAAIVGIQYPYGGNPPSVFDLEVNMDTNHQKFQLDQCVKFVCASQGWAPELLALRQTPSTLGGNLFYDILAAHNEATIVPRQYFFENLFNWMLNELFMNEPGYRPFLGYGICYDDVVARLLEKFKPAQSGAMPTILPSGQIQEIDEEQDAIESGGN